MKRPTPITFRISLIAIVFSMMAGVAACGGQTETEPEEDVVEETQPSQDMSAPADPIASGEESFMRYCASCHGRDGSGDGPVAQVLTTEAADLTQLRAKYGGSFPADSVYAYIDGRQDVRAHGTREMPVWGNVWGEVDGAPVPPEDVDLRIRELVEYIRTLQDESSQASS